MLGIRIFNRSLGKGGVGLGDPVGPLEGQARRLEKSLRNMVASAQMELDQVRENIYCPRRLCFGELLVTR